MSSSRIARAAFWTGLLPLILAPYAVLSAAIYVGQKLGIAEKGFFVPTYDVGIGGILYLAGIPIWISYLWAARPSRKAVELKRFWQTSLALNFVWIAFLGFVLLDSERRVEYWPFFWAVCALFPMIQATLSFQGFRCVCAKS